MSSLSDDLLHVALAQHRAASKRKEPTVYSSSRRGRVDACDAEQRRLRVPDSRRKRPKGQDLSAQLIEPRRLKLRRHRPMFMVDLAVPRDIEPEVARLSDVYLYTVDDLSTLVQTAGEKRQAAVEQAEAIIETINATEKAFIALPFRRN